MSQMSLVTHNAKGECERSQVSREWLKYSFRTVLVNLVGCSFAVHTNLRDPRSIYSGSMVGGVGISRYLQVRSL